MDKKDLMSKFQGAMVGSALGDAIGELAFKYRDMDSLSEAVNAAGVLKYTDDTAMAIGIAEDICKRGDIVVDRLGERFKENFEREPWRGYGPGPPRVFSLVRRGYSYFQAARSLYQGEGSFGNGAAMRITPVGLFYFDSPCLIEKTHHAAEVTHVHPLGKDGAAVLAKAVSEAVKRNRDKELNVRGFIKELVRVSVTAEFAEKINNVNCLLESSETSSSEVAGQLGTAVTAHNSVPYAIFCFLKNRVSFKDCLFDAVLAGGDRDTIGAMACAVSGAYLGIQELPADWINKLENGSYIIELSVKMVEKKYLLE